MLKAKKAAGFFSSIHPILPLEPHKVLQKETLPMGVPTMDWINPQLDELSAIIARKSADIHQILSTYQTHIVTDYEIDRSIRTLAQLKLDKTLVSHGVTGPIAVLLPSNLPLYSLIIFGLIPSLLSKAVFIRPNSILQEQNIISQLYDCLDIERLFSSVQIINENHEGFRKYISDANLVVFTGTPSNAMKILDKMKTESVLIINGSGHNPIVVTDTADIDAAVEGAVFLKGFNSGQDCAGPDAILVHADVAVEFTTKFQARFSSLKAGVFRDPTTMIGPIQRYTELSKFSRMFHDNRVDIICGGTIDFRASIVAPTVIVRGIERYPNYKETYGPVAFIHPYKKDTDLAHYFRDPDGQYNSNRMYVSVYGHSDYVSMKDDATAPGAAGNIGIVLHNQTIHDIEIGFRPYGGYSIGASCVIKKRDKGILQKPMPIYLPDIIINLLIKNDLACLEIPPESTISKPVSASMLQEKEIDPVIVGFKKIVADSFRENIRFAFVFGSAAKRGLKVKGDVRDDLDTFVCLEHDDPEAIEIYKSELATLHQTFGLHVDEDFPTEIISFERLLRVMDNLDKINVSIHSVVEGEIFDHLFWAHAITDKKTGFIGDGKALSSLAKKAIPHISRWRNDIMAQIESEKFVPNHICQRFTGLRKHEILDKMDKLSPHLIIHLGLNYADTKSVGPKL
jgi:acyl-CoA reductase-like NAD-dependent aldehyde dehydrogenase/predicted nucleotidyltransferase